MWDKIKKIFVCAFGFTSGAFMFCGNTVFSILPKNIEIEGVQVGGMEYGAAASKVRNSIIKNIPSLKISAPDGEYVLSYPEIYFTDNFYSVAKGARRGGKYSLDINYYAKGIDALVNNICAQSGKEKIEPYFDFNGSFTYFNGSGGVECDGVKLKKDILSSLSGSFSDIKVDYYYTKPIESIENLKKRTAQISSFTTYFDGENTNRKHNIALAASFINGKSVNVGEEFSFNSAVGRRTQERGFRRAKIISDGRYVMGTGGGVCQVSTTLYNAAILGGMNVTSVRAHSLCVGYVEPSFDAMVSSSSDLKFVNVSPFPVYISADVGENYITVKLYGESSGIKYVRESSVLEYIEPEECLITYGDEEKITVAERRGLKSVGKISAYCGEKKLYEKEIRRDSYKSVRGEKTVKKEE